MRSRGARELALGLVAALAVQLVSMGVPAAAFAQQVEPAGYGQGPGATAPAPAVQQRAPAPQVVSRALPRTGGGIVDDEQWELYALGGVAIAILALIAAQQLRGRRRGMASRAVTRNARTTRALAVLVAAGTAASLTVGWPAAAPAEAQECRVGGAPQRYALTLDDFGRGGGAYVANTTPDYWGNTGFLSGFARSEGDAFLSQPFGAYVYGGIVLASNPQSAASDHQNALAGWTREWKDREAIDVPLVGDEIFAYRRQTDWTAWTEGGTSGYSERMIEVFLSFRRCNATAHFLVAVAPEWDPVFQAVRYAQIVNSRFAGG